MGEETPETCGAVNERQDNELKKLLHLVGDLFELNIKLRCQKVKTALLYALEANHEISFNASDPVPLFCPANLLKALYLTRQTLQHQNVFTFVSYEFYLRTRRFSYISIA